MRISIEIPPRLETKLRDALARGDNREAETILVDAVRPTLQTLLSAPQHDLTDEEFEALADEFADEFEAILGPNAPPLPDEALTREGIYGDHP
jgi:antitoxin ParD1/3/4